MRKICAIWWFAFCVVNLFGQGHSFAIVVDKDSYEACRSELEAYRESVAKGGLDAFIVAKQWSNPEEVKDSLQTYYHSRSLEGAVFVGDIPIPMIRQAQHLTSAFKMNEERYEKRNSSVPSDRFYDDFDLRFDFVEQDSLETQFFYYNLSFDSPQRIECDIYTGRIKPVAQRQEAYRELSAYLQKVVRIKAEQNRIDHVCSYTGEGSFSNSMIAWKDETITLSEQFPETSQTKDGNKCYFFDMYPSMKDLLIKEIQRDELDIMLFHEHGMPERQYLTGTPKAEDMDAYYELGRYHARNAVRNRLRYGDTPKEAKQYVWKHYGIDSLWYGDPFAPDLAEADSLADLKTGIVLSDIKIAKPNVRLSLFDACYNGDFREPDCVASSYIMALGNSVVSVGNSVNVLQDKSSSDLMGLLAFGYSVGQWMMQVNILESHILGDPTFAFASSYESFSKPDLHQTNCAYWLGYTQPSMPSEIVGLALHQLFKLRYDDKAMSDLLLDTYRRSDSYMLRLQCMHLLAHYDDGNYTLLLAEALEDPYEFIRRKAAFYCGKVGDARLVDPLVALYLNDYNAKRVRFNIAFSAGHFEEDRFMPTLNQAIDQSAFVFDKPSFKADAEQFLATYVNMMKSSRKAILAVDEPARRRQLYLSSMRNNPYPHLADELISVLQNDTQEMSLRLSIAELLGWYVRSWNRSEIVASLETYLASDANLTEELRREIQKSIHRLNDYRRGTKPTSLPSLTQQTNEEPVYVAPLNKKSRTSFAIITDALTYERCREGLEAYKEVLEQEGLPTHLVAQAWTSPDEVKERILALAKGKQPLEGVVLVGEVPIAMIRQGQHTTTAFKMNEDKYPIFESSVASDRFYDDFDLAFEFISKDEERDNIFYYRLSETGTQQLRPDIYSARMKVPETMQGDKYAILNRYLEKVVEAHRETNSLDQLIFFAGHGYNSDCLTLWRQKPLLYRDYFPYAFERSSSNRFLNFRQEDYMKYALFNEIQREETDLFVFSEHGAYNMQYINSTGVARNLKECYEQLKESVGNYYRRYYKGTEDDEAFLKETLDSLYCLPRSVVCDSALEAYAQRSQEAYNKANISLDDIYSLNSNARVILFNACYNGSFHHPKGYVAGAHVFGPGKCIVAQGNTVNVLQDKWEDKLFGLLSMGERVGVWHKENPYLEAHLIGDPTFRFASHNAQEAEIVAKIHRDMYANAHKASVWKRYLKSDDPMLRSLGVAYLTQLTNSTSAKESARLSDCLLDRLKHDPSPIVRIHAINGLALLADDNAPEVIRTGLNDNIELVARTACRMAAAYGDKSLLPDIQAFAERHPEMMRASGYACDNAQRILNNGYAKFIATASNREKSDEVRIDAIRLFRNNRVIEVAPVLLELVGSASESDKLRVVACEALGWYADSSQKAFISGSLRSLLESTDTLSDPVRKEIIKTIKRLRAENSSR